MKRFLAFALGVAMSTAAAAQGDETRLDDIHCRATHEIGCTAASCERTAGDSIYVGVSFSSTSGMGHICTYTYCRDFALVPNPGETVEAAVARGTGFTWSQSRGSTEPNIGRPTIDYQLSLSEDRTTFVLGGVENGGFFGWAGTCGAAPQE